MTHQLTRSLKVAGFLAYTSIKKGNYGVILLTVVILAIAALNLLFVSGLLNGLVATANDKIRTVYSGDIVIESATGNPFVADVAALVSEVESIDGVVAAAPRNSLGAEISFQNERANCIIYGIWPQKERAVLKTSEYLIEGSYLEPDDKGEIILGIQLAGADTPSIELYPRSLRTVHAGDTIQVAYANGVNKTYRVKGIFHTKFIQTDIQAYVSEAEFESVNPLAKDRASSVLVKIDDGIDAASVIGQVQRIKDGLRTLVWEDYAGIIRSMTDSFNIINAILNIVNLLIVGITVFIVTYIDVSNRRRQIGIQRAIGITHGSITIAYVLRAVFYAIVASVLAILAFLYVVVPIEARHPFHFPFGDVYLVTTASILVRAALVLLCAAVVAAFVPIWMALRVRILDAIWA